jgi:hypothetical protein
MWLIGVLESYPSCDIHIYEIPFSDTAAKRCAVRRGLVERHRHALYRAGIQKLAIIEWRTTCRPVSAEIPQEDV